MAKLYVITRDGKAVHDFSELHGIPMDNLVVVKSAKDLKYASIGDSYVILTAKLPDSYHFRIRPILLNLEMKNVTRFYTNKLNIF